jgi:GWxTD domain-containing protein
MGPVRNTRSRTALLVMLVASAGCQWQRVGSEAAPDPSVVVPELFDPASLYRRLGFLASGPPLPYVGGLRFLATGSPDTTLAVFAVSLANAALSFRRTADAFEATYTPEFTLRRDGRVLVRLNSEERVRVATREEARRADESIVFQKLLRVAPGNYDAVVSVRDEQTGTVGRVEQVVTVPRFERPGLAQMAPVYQAAGRASPDDAPPILLNPRATVPFGLDTLRVYLEAYGAPTPPRAHVTLYGATGDSVLARDLDLSGTTSLAWAVLALPPGDLPVGEVRITARVDGVPDTAQLRALVSFSDQWAITNFEEILSLLRYFGHDRAIAEMREAEPGERSALWRAFWKATDSNPLTPQNESLELYFRRVQEANQRFREAGEPGWITDRGEVFIGLGEPDEIFDSSSDLQGPARIIRWTYLGERLLLDFVDDTGFGRFRLTPTSRSEFMRVLNMVRSRG